MAQLNANIPYQKAFVRNCYLFSDTKNKETTPCYMFGVKAMLNRPLTFHCQLNNGAIFWNLPISAFVHKEAYAPMGVPEERLLSYLQWWDCQGSDVAVTVFAYLENHYVDCRDRLGTWRRGKYLFTIDDYYSDLNALPLGYASDADSKCFHFIELDNGYYCAYPNNFLRWHNLNFVDPYDKNNPPRYRSNRWEMVAENIKP